MTRIDRERAGWMRPADEEILEFMRGRRGEYSAIVANRLGMHTPYVETRLRTLATYGLLESGGEGVYRLADDGRAFLDGTLDSSALRSASD